MHTLISSAPQPGQGRTEGFSQGEKCFFGKASLENVRNLCITREKHGLRELYSPSSAPPTSLAPSSSSSSIRTTLVRTSSSFREIRRTP